MRMDRKKRKRLISGVPTVRHDSRDTAVEHVFPSDPGAPWRERGAGAELLLGNFSLITAKLGRDEQEE